jgi:uncharacterized protein GlcG (DUF336 family)
MRRAALACALLAALTAVLPGCNSGSTSGNASASPEAATGQAGCVTDCATAAPAAAALTIAEVEQILSQAVQEAQAQQAPATLAVVDRVGNVLAVFAMNGASPSITINGGKGIDAGLDKVSLGPPVPGPAFAAISMAITAAYFSSEGNAFTSRTAGQIIQEQFNPGERNQPSGPLFGVQFSQITCSDISRKASDGSIGPKRAPLGFAANPGGLPLYKNGRVVGAIGVMTGTDYTLDRNVIDVRATPGELIAVAGTRGFSAPTDIRADRITVEGRSLRFTDSEQTVSAPGTAASFKAINGVAGALVAVAGYGGSPIAAGTVYGTPASGIRPDASAAFAGTGAHVLVDANDVVRFPPRDGTDGGLSAADVTQILRSALAVADRTRSQVRRPVGLRAQVSAVVVDTNGEILGHVRSPDALVDSADVVVQKARTAAFFSNPQAGAELLALPPASYVNGTRSPIAPYVVAARTLLADPTALGNGIAFSTRSVGNLATPYFPDGLEYRAAGPFAKPTQDWTLFNNGLALDLVYDKLVAALGGDLSGNCTGNARIRNGITLFGGGFPIYRGNRLVGGIGVSGDGTEQSDLIALVGVAQAGQRLGNGIGNAPPAIRADTLSPQGTGSRLRYANCPVAPFLDSTDSNVCQGL